MNATPPNLLFSAFSSLGLSLANNFYFQYRAILETDSANVADGSELQSVTVGPTHYEGSAPNVYNSEYGQ